MIERKKIEVTGTVAGKKVIFQSAFGIASKRGCPSSFGDTVALSTVLMSSEPKLDIDFFPLTVDYEEKSYAVGKIPGGFLRRKDVPLIWRY